MSAPGPLFAQWISSHDTHPKATSKKKDTQPHAPPKRVCYAFVCLKQNAPLPHSSIYQPFHPPFLQPFLICLGLIFCARVSAHFFVCVVTLYESLVHLCFTLLTSLAAALTDRRRALNLLLGPFP